jgi:hypothetical protein
MTSRLPPANVSRYEDPRRLAQRGTPLTALLRAYRLGHARFCDWARRELAQQAGDARLISTAWAWLPLGGRDTFDPAAAGRTALGGDVHVAFGDAAKGTAACVRPCWSSSGPGEATRRPPNG